MNVFNRILFIKNSTLWLFLFFFCFFYFTSLSANHPKKKKHDKIFEKNWFIFFRKIIAGNSINCNRKKFLEYLIYGGIAAVVILVTVLCMRPSKKTGPMPNYYEAMYPGYR